MIRQTLARVFHVSITMAVVGLSMALAGTAVAEDTIEKMKQAGVMKVGVRFDAPPMGTVDNGGKPVGFSVDLGNMIAEKLGVKAEFVQATPKSRIQLLLNGNIDLQIDTLTPTRERNEIVDFTIPFAWDGGVLVVRKGDSLDVKSYGPPKKLAGLQGNYWVKVVQQTVPNAQFTMFQEFPDTFVALMNKKVDGVAINKVLAVAVVKQHPELTMSNNFYEDPWAIAVRQNDSKWRNFLNFYLQELWCKGTYQALYAKWFGEAPKFHLWSEARLQPGICD